MIKRIFITVLCVVFVYSCAGCSDKDDLPALSVDNIRNDPMAFEGEIKINGVVEGISEEDGTVFTVKDIDELLFCLDLYCSAYAMPAKYIGRGSMPELELADVVDVTGSFVQTGTGKHGYQFEVTKILVRRNIMDLLTNTGAPLAFDDVYDWDFGD